MKINRNARNKYNLEDFEFNGKGNLTFKGEIYPIRLFAQKLNKDKDLINFPEMAVKIGQLNGMALISEIYNHLFEYYKKKIADDALYKELYHYLEKNIGEEEIEEAVVNMVEEFPPNEIFKNRVEIDEFIEEKTEDLKNKHYFVDEFLFLWLSNKNPAFNPYIDLFDDDILKKKINYKKVIKNIKKFFENKPSFGPKDQNLVEMLNEPAKTHPYSIKNQLEFIHQNWEEYLGDYATKILIALDLIREEEMMRGLGPGEAKILEFETLEYENFTPDKEWMPKVIMIAKHTYVWLDQLSKRYNREISKLDQIPDEELERLRNWGFNALWLIGVWERSQASKTIKQWCGNPEAAPSAYSLYDYVIAHELGGHQAYDNLKERARRKGIRLASDMVPNHTGIVSKWTMEHPEWFIQLPYKPFPSYSYSGRSLSGASNIGFFIEDKYFNRTDAAVTFKRENYSTSEVRFIYHGNDGTSFPWNDTAQLNYLLPEVREAVIQKILQVSRMFPIIRFDAAMTLTRKHFHRLWFPEPGTGGAIPSRAEHGISKKEFYEKMPKEFWREVVDRINEENPDTLLIAEAFWLLEGFFVRTLGMHRVYNSAFMNMLSDEDNAKYRAVIKNTLQFDPKILKRFVNFMNNPDEETAKKQFGTGDKYFGVCVMLVTMPGLPMFGHGQIEGFEEKYGMEYKRSYWDEDIDWGLLHHHENTIFKIMKKRYLFADVSNFYLYDFYTDGYVNEDVFAYSNKVNNERALVFYNNNYSKTTGYIKTSVGFIDKKQEDNKIIQITLSDGLDLPIEGYCIFRDYMNGLEYIRRNKDLSNDGFKLHLDGYKASVFMDFRIVQDDEFFHYAQLHDLLDGRGVQNIDQTFQEVIYQPLHNPFEKIVNEKQFKKIIDSESIHSLSDEFLISFNRFLNQVKNYSNGENSVDKIEKKILRKLDNVLNLQEKIENMKLEEKIKQKLNNLFPNNNFEWGILLSWIFIHQLGKVKKNKNYELLTRSWIDEWHLSKYIQLTLENLKQNDDQNAWDATQLIIILITHQNRFIKDILENKKIDKILRELFSDSDLASFLNFNRYQENLWLSKEKFEWFCNWFLLITVINRFSRPDDDLIKDIESIVRIIEHWIYLAKKSEYKVSKLVNFVKDIDYQIY